MINDRIKEFFDKELYKNRTEICEIFKNEGSDKSTWHNYSSFYNYIFSSHYNDTLNIFEVGLGTNNINVPSNMGINGIPGASLRAFSKIFKNSNIYGADVDKTILFEQERIKTFFVDQTDSTSIRSMWDLIDDIEFDIMIDDGLHDFSANVNFFENSFYKLKFGGCYIIEDIMQPQLNLFHEYFKNTPFDWHLLNLPIDTNWNDNVNPFDNSILYIIK